MVSFAAAQKTAGVRSLGDLMSFGNMGAVSSQAIVVTGNPFRKLQKTLSEESQPPAPLRREAASDTGGKDESDPFADMDDVIGRSLVVVIRFSLHIPISVCSLLR